MPASTSSPASIASRRIPRQTGGRRPPATATPTSATVGLVRERVRDGGDDRDALDRLPGALRVEHGDDGVAARSG